MKCLEKCDVNIAVCSIAQTFNLHCPLAHVTKNIPGPKCPYREIRILRETLRRAKHDFTAYMNQLLCVDSNGGASSRMEPLEITQDNTAKMFRAHRRAAVKAIDKEK